MEKYFPPVFQGSNFCCPHCRVYAHQIFNDALVNNQRGGFEMIGVYASRCAHCGENALWVNKQLMYPTLVSAPPVHDDMPEQIIPDFEEARQIANKSPRGAAALLRLCVQKIMVALGQPGKKIDDDIAALVKNGLPVTIQQALDSVRVIGNESVHPGELDLNDTPELAMALFGLVNLIVDNRIAEPKRVAEIYSTLPKGKLAGIQQRDAKKP